MKPNIFTYATSELSQDAFFCWLLEWSKDEYRNDNMHKLSLDFINYILRSTGKSSIESVKELKIERQDQKIDFYAIFNNSVIIMFEDKTETKQHDNQLKKYKNIMESKFKGKQISYVYIKSDIIWKDERDAVEDAGYYQIDIFEMINILKPYQDNEIYDGYLKNILQKVNVYNTYRNKPYSEWKNNFEAWKGLYSQLDKANCGSMSSWGGSLKTWFSLFYYYVPEEHYIGEVDGYIDFTVVLENDTVSIDIETKDAKADIQTCCDYVMGLLENSPLGKNYKLVKCDGGGRPVHPRVATISDVLVLRNDGILDTEKTIANLLDIKKAFEDIMKHNF
jgi:hypothetical protein